MEALKCEMFNMDNIECVSVHFQHLQCLSHKHYSSNGPEFYDFVQLVLCGCSGHNQISMDFVAYATLYFIHRIFTTEFPSSEKEISKFIYKMTIET